MEISSKTYPSNLQNYLIDIGSEIILIDTGVPKETPDTLPKKEQKIYLSSAEADAIKLSRDNIVRVEFNSGKYHNFELSEKIIDGVYLI
ncbi:hypothetical protein CLPUN_35370 [Clostridium puniceum]|uniref:Uncharacterized protein n=1 Tax=Clostridium puniceum TaxID=29367 RepID=A0A1S8TBE1_9CLOT|nr:hypothetical protein [Clostridium puniceum]OOM75100.1 hypothetical protein CLPUN_35370 [Clostridium puniceum]